uniref:HNH endonuclease n=1 Tax=Candidatus Kentrum sp. UNK TaxID=2126344 RepID=A0A450ZYU1_9GAMM|nr:MAG: HNH endonuclease [Candidatus Kentron sp. UNK]VFK68638.1 MAG: HNH endonuclease [Candidatus Kentron sp. UNK]
MPKNKRRHWTQEEISLLRAEYADAPTGAIARRLGRTERAVYSQANDMGLGKSPTHLARMRAEAAERVRVAGEKTRFSSGHASWNRGLRGLHLGGKETRFAPGHRPAQWVPVGTEVIDKDGYRKRKVRDDTPPGESRRNWMFCHVLAWEAENGPAPPGHCVVFRNGDRADIRIENLELIDRAERLRRNSIHRYPEAVKELIWARHRLKRAIRKREQRDEKQHDGRQEPPDRDHGAGKGWRDGTR